jgi:hypothetical protein
MDGPQQSPKRTTPAPPRQPCEHVWEYCSGPDHAAQWACSRCDAAMVAPAGTWYKWENDAVYISNDQGRTWALFMCFPPARQRGPHDGCRVYRT